MLLCVTQTAELGSTLEPAQNTSHTIITFHAVQ